MIVRQLSWYEITDDNKKMHSIFITILVLHFLFFNYFIETTTKFRTLFLVDTNSPTYTYLMVPVTLNTKEDTPLLVGSLFLWVAS